MARHFLRSTRPLVRAARNNIEIVATLAAIAAAAVIPLPSSGGTSGGGREGARLDRRDRNVRLTVASPSGTDTLAFDLMR